MFPTFVGTIYFHGDGWANVDTQADTGLPWCRNYATWSVVNVVGPTEFEIATLFPDFFEPDVAGRRGEKIFLVALGRYVIKYPPKELAVEGIVHELVSHGIQYLHGRLEGMRGERSQIALNLVGLISV